MTPQQIKCIEACAALSADGALGSKMNERLFIDRLAGRAEREPEAELAMIELRYLAKIGRDLGLPSDAQIEIEESQAKASADGSSGKNETPAEQEGVSRSASGRSLAATSEKTDETARRDGPDGAKAGGGLPVIPRSGWNSPGESPATVGQNSGDPPRRLSTQTKLFDSLEARERKVLIHLLALYPEEAREILDAANVREAAE